METEEPGTVGTAAGLEGLGSDATAWAASRKLSAATLARMGVKSGTVFFPDLGRKSRGVFFPYTQGWKARAFPEKSFVSGGGFKSSFWNLSAVLSRKPDEVYITEGELDACALVEAGVPPEKVLSVPTGAKLPSSQPTPRETRGYGYALDALASGLGAAKKFIWCGDSDPAGDSLRDDLCRVLGAARFWTVTWPDGIKDPNDFLIKEGPDAPRDLRDLVENGALVFPIKGLYRLHELSTPPALTVWDTGFSPWMGKIALADRSLSVVTGHPNHGKTQMFGQIWYQIVNAYDLVACIASFETKAKPHIRRQLRTLYSGTLERDMGPAARDDADNWINDHYLFIVHPEECPSIEWLLDMAEVAVVRHGAKIIQVDPWNRLESSRAKDENETEYIGRCLRTMHVFAHDMNCHVQIIAHPAKMHSSVRGQPPLLEDISGSKHWDNMVDQGFVVHRPELFDGETRKTEAVIYHRKARFDELGYPCRFKLNYDIAKGCYYPILDEEKS